MMIIKNKFFHIITLMFISSLFLSMMAVVMTDLSIIALLEKILGTVCVTMMVYLIVSKIGMKVHIGQKTKKIIIFVIFLIFALLAFMNISQMHDVLGSLERTKDIQLGSILVDKYQLASFFIFILFPVIATWIADIVMKYKNGVIEFLVATVGLHIMGMLSLFGLRLASMLIVSLINTVVVCYLLRRKFKISKRIIFTIIAMFVLIIGIIIFEYSHFYHKELTNSIQHYWTAIPMQMREIYRNLDFFGMNTAENSFPYLCYDCMSPFVIALTQFGAIPYLITVLLAIMMILLILNIVKTVEKRANSDVKKVITLALGLHLMLATSMTMLISFGIPVIPMHFPFYFQETRYFLYTVSGIGDIAIATTLILIYIETPQKRENIGTSQKKENLEKTISTKKGVAMDETVSI